MIEARRLWGEMSVWKTLWTSRTRMLFGAACLLTFAATGESNASSVSGGATSIEAEVPQSSPTSSAGAEDNRVLEEVVVTGTLIHTSDPVSPITTLSHDDLVNQGYTRIQDALEQLPQNFKGGAAEDVNGITSAGANANANQAFASSVNLRGLGPNATLVLLNGERLGSTAFGSATDISIIPLSIVDRIEVLTDGASATYGSDAIAGVVNIITRKNFTGVEVSARTAGVSQGKSPDYGAAITGGQSWGTGNVMDNLDYERTTPLFARDRSFTATLPDPTILLPGQEKSSFYLNLRQDLTERLSTAADVALSKRHFTAVSALFGLDQSSGNSEQINATAHLDYALQNAWTVKLIGHLAQDRDVIQRDDPPPSAFTESQRIRDVDSSVALRSQGPLLTVHAGDIDGAAGMEFRRESYYTDIDAADLSGVPFFVQDLNPSTRVYSAYGELLVPLIGAEQGFRWARQLRADIAVRYDHYNAFGATTNPKFALQWTLVDGMSLHGSFARSFKAPSLEELGGIPIQATILDAPNPASPSGTSTALIIDGSDPHLLPERSRSVNFGMSYAPATLASLKAELSYFRIDYDQKIDRLRLDGFFDNVFEQANELGSLINLHPTIGQINAALGTSAFPLECLALNCAPGAVAAIANIGYVNVGTSRLQGLDGSLRYGVDTAYGNISGEASGSYFLKYRNRITATSADFVVDNTIYNPLRLRAKFNLRWTRAPWAVNARLNYANAYHNANDPACPPPGCGVSSWTTTDLSISYANPDRGTLWDGIRVALDVVNVFDRKPPFAFDPFSFFYDPTNASPLGRALGLSVTKRWGGISQH